MLTKQLFDQAQSKISQTESHFNEELKKLRTGRAHPSMLDSVQVKAYGVVMPLNQVGNVLAPEPQSLQITPFDPTNIQAISEAIRSDQSLGLNPSDDGRVVRIPIPALTTERRQQIVKQLNEKAEEAHIACRNIRHEVLGQAKQAKTDKDMGEDDYSRLEKQVDDLMTATKSEIEKAAKLKEQEIMTV